MLRTSPLPASLIRVNLAEGPHWAGPGVLTLVLNQRI